jgi:hypothetical protein
VRNLLLIGGVEQQKGFRKRRKRVSTQLASCVPGSFGSIAMHVFSREPNLTSTIYFRNSEMNINCGAWQGQGD